MFHTTGVVEKLGYVLSVIEFGLFLNSLSSISIAELEAKEALSVKVKDSHFSLQLLIISVIQFQPDGSPVHVDGMEVSASGTMDVTHWEQSCSKQRRIFP